MLRLRIVFVFLMVILGALPGGSVSAHAQGAGYALKFDGTSDFVRLATTDAMLGPAWATTKTVSLWVKPTGNANCTGPDPASCDVIFGDRPRAWGISRGPINGVDRIWIWNYDGSLDRVGIEYTTGAWIHVALVHGGGALRAYKNGEAAGSVVSGPTLQIVGQTLHFGGIISNSTKNWTFEGEIDELQIWNVARSSEEILNDSTRMLTGTEPNLVAYYQMTDGVGAWLTDNTGRGWAGTLSDGGSGIPADGPIQWVPSGALDGGVVVVNQPPTAFSQECSTSEDLPLPVTLTAMDPDGDVLMFRILSPPAHGTLSGVPPALTYTPQTDYNGADTFTFAASDGRADSVPATVRLIVAAVNDPPVANDDVASTDVDMPVGIAVLTNDVERDAEPLTLAIASQPANGTVVADASRVTYFPNAGFSGTDSFTYTATDGSGASAIALVTVTVKPPASGAGYALKFDGTSDFVTLGYTSEMLPSGWEQAKTVSLWVRPTGAAYCSSPGPAACDAIFGDRSRWWGISRGTLDGLDRIWVWNWDGNSDAVPVPYTPGEWVHVALVHQNGQLSAYRNGVFVGSVASGPTQQPHSGARPELQLGAVINNVNRNWSFSGEIDEVAIWGLARSPEEIAQEASEPLTGSEAGLAALYRMTEGSGSQVSDDSGHGWTGTLHDGGQGVAPDGVILWVLSGAFRL